MAGAAIVTHEVVWRGHTHIRITNRWVDTSLYASDTKLVKLDTHLRSTFISFSSESSLPLSAFLSMILTANNWPGFSLLSPSRTSEKAPLQGFGWCDGWPRAWRDDDDVRYDDEEEEEEEGKRDSHYTIRLLKCKASGTMTEGKCWSSRRQKILWIKLKVRSFLRG